MAIVGYVAVAGVLVLVGICIGSAVTWLDNYDTWGRDFGWRRR